MSFLLPTLPGSVTGWPAYSFFYLLGFGVAGGLLLWEGMRRGLPWRPWLLLVAGTVLALIAGTQLITGGTAEWQTLFKQGHWGSGAAAGRSVLGGMAGAWLALAGLRRLLGFGREATDAFALPFVLGLAVQGVGCLLTGCCFGESLGTSFGIGALYGPGTAPFQAQVAEGLLPAGATHSWPVHATQLYQLGLCLSIAGLLLWHRRSLRQYAGVALPLAFGLYAAGRFGLEFVRSPLGDVVGAGLWHGLKPVQWGLLLAVAALAAVVVQRRRGLHPIGKPTQPLDQPLRNMGLLLAFLVLPAWLLPGCFDLGETLVLRALLLPVVLLEGYRLVRVLRLTQPLPAALLVLSLGLMSQTPAPTPAAADAVPGPALTLGLGGFTGSSYQLYAPPSVGCGSPQRNIRDFQGYSQRYSAVAGSAVYELPVNDNGRNAFRFGIDAFWGQTSFDPPAARVGVVSPTDSLVVLEQAGRRTLYSVNPNVEFYAPGGPTHRLHLRYGMGIHLSRQAGFDYVTEPLRRRSIVPSAIFEIGYRNILWTYSSVYYGADAIGNGTARLGLGTGFGRDNVILTSGVAYTNSNGLLEDNYGFWGNKPFYAPEAAFAQLHWRVSPAWQLEASALSNFNDVSRFSLGTRYRLPITRK